MAQTESHANPPTFLLTLEKLLRDRQKPDARPQSPHEAAFFKAMLPALSQILDLLYVWSRILGFPQVPPVLLG